MVTPAENTLFVDATGAQWAGYIGSDGKFYALEPMFKLAPLAVPGHAYSIDTSSNVLADLGVKQQGFVKSASSMGDALPWFIGGGVAAAVALAAVAALRQAQKYEEGGHLAMLQDAEYLTNEVEAGSLDALRMSAMSTTTKVGLGVAAAAVLGLGAYFATRPAPLHPVKTKAAPKPYGVHPPSAAPSPAAAAPAAPPVLPTTMPMGMSAPSLPSLPSLPSSLGGLASQATSALSSLGGGSSGGQAMSGGIGDLSGGGVDVSSAAFGGDSFSS